MANTRPLLLILIFGLAAWAAEPRATMVLQVKGNVTAAIGGRIKPLRTLQALPKGVEIRVAKEGVLRLTYLQSGRKETVTGPFELRTGATASDVIGKNQGHLEAEASGGSTTLVPKSENLRRMGGALHATADLDALGLVASIPVEKGGAREVRLDPKPRIQDFSPSHLELTAGREIFWIGGLEPYQVKLVRDDGEVAAEQSGNSSALPLPRLESGHTYTLSVTDSKGSHADPLEFYMLSQQEAGDLRRDLDALAEENSRDRQAELIAAIAYLESRGLLQEALPLAQEAVRHSPDDIGLLTTLGRLQLNLGRHEEAETTLNHAIQLDAKESNR